MAVEKGERILPRYIEDELKDSFLDYSMSVIVSRALPDVRDGLKPVHRRILYAMQEIGLAPNRPLKKAAAVVGDVLGKYHPHGDLAVYDALVRMVQDFSLRLPLIQGQGNFGSVDGDPPAAYRYTECRLSQAAMEMLADLDKGTVDFVPNFDGRLQEPTVVPSLLPNLLVNGASGIAVGMATNIPPHNLGEVVDACVALVDNPDLGSDELMEYVQAPDFPTGGYICGEEGIREAYRTGRGRIIMRARAQTEQHAGGKESIVITEIPYQVNKTRMIEQIADLVRGKKIEGITEIRDESDREGMRVVLELKRDASSAVILNQLYQRTQMQWTFGAILLALVNGVPQVLTLRQLISHFLDHRHEVVTRKARYELAQAEERAHILEGLQVALEHIDEIVQLIKKAKDTEAARKQLQKQYDLSERQAQAILDMRLARLTSLERSKVEEEFKGLIKEIARLEALLESKDLRMTEIKQDLLRIKETYADERRTEVIGEAVELTPEDLIAEEEMVITVSNAGYIKRIPIDTFRQQRRGGRGSSGAATRDEDYLAHLFVATTHDYFLCLDHRGQCHWLKVHEIPQGGRAAKGRPIVNLLGTDGETRVTAFLPAREFDDDHYVLMVTRKGMVKKTVLSAFGNPRWGGIIGINLKEGDELIAAAITDGQHDVILGTWEGMSIRFSEGGVRPMGRDTQGVIGIRLRKKDYVVGAVVLKREGMLLAVSEKGFGKRTPASEYRPQGRAGQGVLTMKCGKQVGKLVTLREVTEDDEVMLITREGVVIRSPARDIRVTGRNAQGVHLIKLEGDDVVVDVARLTPEMLEAE